MRNLALVTSLCVSALIFSSCTKAKDAAAPADLAKLKADLSANPSYENHIALGLETGKSGDSNGALELYRKALEINSAAPLAWNNICAELNNQKKFSEAVGYCEKAVQLDPKFQIAANNLKVATDGNVNANKSIGSDKAALLGQASPPADQLVDLGMRYYSLKKYDEAIDLWSRVASGNQFYAVAQNDLASAFILQKNFAKADAALKNAEAIDPKNPLFINNRKWLEQEKSAVKK